MDDASSVATAAKLVYRERRKPQTPAAVGTRQLEAPMVGHASEVARAAAEGTRSPPRCQAITRHHPEARWGSGNLAGWHSVSAANGCRVQHVASAMAETIAAATDIAVGASPTHPIAAHVRDTGQRRLQ